MLVAKQINCEWRCTCEALKPLYECALNLMSQLRSHPLTTAVSLRHVYREYNADADGVCNEVLDRPTRAPTEVCVNWARFCDVDADGDTVMRQ